MRRIAFALMGTVSGVVLLFSYPTSLNRGATLASGGATAAGTTSGTAAAPPTASSSSSSASSSGSGTYKGDAVDTRWGVVQVQITVSDGTITKAEAVQYPQANQKDRQINAYALPVLEQEATQAQSAHIDAVSGATVTSDGYIASLQSAIDQAHL